MVRHEYWLEIFPHEVASTPWKVVVTETRTYKTIESVLLRTDEEVKEKVRSYFTRYGKDQVKVGEHVYYLRPKFTSLYSEE